MMLLAQLTPRLVAARFITINGNPLSAVAGVVACALSAPVCQRAFGPGEVPAVKVSSLRVVSASESKISAVVVAATDCAFTSLVRADDEQPKLSLSIASRAV